LDGGKDGRNDGTWDDAPIAIRGSALRLLTKYLANVDYYRLSKREEQPRVHTFGAAYKSYRQRLPMFIPRRGEWKKLVAAGQFRASKK
jgi:hypothetical protein